MIETTVTIVIQVQGKLRDKIDVAKDMDSKELEALALASEKIKNTIGDQKIRKIIVVPNRIVNIVV